MKKWSPEKKRRKRYERDLAAFERSMDVLDPGWRARKNFAAMTALIGESLREGLKGFVGRVNDVSAQLAMARKTIEVLVGYHETITLTLPQEAASGETDP